MTKVVIATGSTHDEVVKNSDAVGEADPVRVRKKKLRAYQDSRHLFMFTLFLSISRVASLQYKQVFVMNCRLAGFSVEEVF